MQTRTLTQTSLLTALFVILALATIYIPPLSVVSLLILGLPHAFIGYNHGVKAGIISIIVSSIILFLLMDIVVAFSAVSMFATVGVAIGVGAKRFSSGRTILLSTIVGALSFAFFLLVVKQIFAIDMFGDTIAIYREGLKATFDNELLTSLLGKNVDYKWIENTLILATGALKPTFIFGYGFMVTYVTYKMFQILGRRFKILVPRMKNLFEHSFPTWVGVTFVVGNILSLFGAKIPILYTIGINLHTIFSIPVILQGISMIILYFSKYIRSRLFYLLLIILILVNPFLLRVVSFVGLFDMLFDYRGFIKEKGDK